MSYNYQNQKPNIFTEQGSVLFMKIRDNTHSLIQQAGVARMQEIMRGCGGDTWDMLACVDRLVELGELLEVSPPGCAGQHRLFIRAKP